MSQFSPFTLPDRIGAYQPFGHEMPTPQFDQTQDQFLHHDFLFGWQLRDEAPTLDRGLRALDRSFENRHLNHSGGIFGRTPQSQMLFRGMLGEQAGLGRTLMEMFIPFSTKSDVQQILSESDPDFDNEKAWQEFAEQSPDLVEFLNRRGFTHESLANADNERAFKFAINLELKRAQLEQHFDQYEQNVPWLSRKAKETASVATNWFLFDPDLLRTLPLAGTGQIVGAAGRTVGAVTQGTRLAPVGGTVANTVGQAHRIRPIIHEAVKDFRYGRLAAISTESAMWGAAWSVGDQLAALEMNDLIGEDEARSFSLGEVGLGALFGAGMILAPYSAVMGTRKAHSVWRSSKQEKLQKLRQMDLHDSPIASLGPTAEGMAAQYGRDKATARINETLQAITGEASASNVQWRVSPRLIESYGRTVEEVQAIVERWGWLAAKAKKRGIPINTRMITDDLDDFLRTGKNQNLTEAERRIFHLEQGKAHRRKLLQKNPQRLKEMQTRRTQLVEARKRLDAARKGRITEKTRRPAEFFDDLFGFKLATKRKHLTFGEAKQLLTQRLARVNDDLKPYSDKDIRKQASRKVRKEIAEELAAGGDYVPRTQSGQALRRLEALLVRLDELEGVKTGVPVARAKSVVDPSYLAQAERLRRAEKARVTRQVRKELEALKEAYPPQERVSDALPALKNADKLTRREQDIVIMAIMENADGVEMVKGLNRLWDATLGTPLGEVARGLISNLEGYGAVSSRGEAALNLLNDLANLFGNPRWTTASFGNGAPGAMNVHAQQLRALRDIGPILRTHNKLLRKAGVRFINNDIKERTHRAVVRHMAGVEKIDPNLPWAKEAMDFINAWDRFMQRLNDVGVETGLLPKFTEKGVFFPHRVNVQKVSKNFDNAVSDLGRWWRKKALEGDDTNVEFMESLGWVDLQTGPDGRVTGVVTVSDSSPLAPFKKAFEADPKNRGKEWQIPKSKEEIHALDPRLVDDYHKFIDTPMDNGWTAVENTSRRYLQRHMGEETFRGSARDFNESRFRAMAAKSHGYNRTFTSEEIMASPELSQWFDFDLGQMIQDYARRTATPIYIQQMMNQWMKSRGVPVEGLSLFKMLEVSERYLMDTAPQHLHTRVKHAFTKMHETLALYQAGLPRVASDYNVALNFGYELGKESANVAFASGIGGTIGGVEWMVALMRRMGVSIGELGAKLVDSATVIPAVRDKLGRRMIEGTALEAHRMSYAAINRFTASSADSQMEVTLMGQFLRPWKNAIDSISGRAAQSIHGYSRGQQATLDVTRAVGRTGHLLGMTQPFTEMAWAATMRSNLTEIHTFRNAVPKLVQLLAENPLTGTAEQQTRKFMGLARQAGFGRHPEVALRLSDAGLLDAQVWRDITRLREISGQTGRHWDMEPLQAALWSMNKNDYHALAGSYHRLSTYIEKDVQKRVSEAWGLIRPTAASHRTPMGAFVSTMFSFSRSWAINNMYDGQGMPAGQWMALMGTFMFFQTTYDTLRRYLRGESAENIKEAWERDPMGEAAQAALRTPFAGRFTFLAEAGAAAVRRTYNDDIRKYPVEFHQSAATGAAGKMVQAGHMAWNAMTDPSSVTDGDQHRMIQTAIDFAVPGANAIYMDALDRIFDARGRQAYKEGANKPSLERRHGVDNDRIFNGQGNRPVRQFSPDTIRQRRRDPEERFDLLSALGRSPDE
jgi:hypothetical protein